MKPLPKLLISWRPAVLVLLLGGVPLALAVKAADDKAKPAAARAALTVTATQPQQQQLAQSITASGSIAAWQDAVIGAEANGLRLAEVLVNVGDRVRRGQVLARFTADLVRTDLAQSRAAVAEAEAALAEEQANAQRARELQASGALSAQQINRLLTAERTAQARLEALRAQLQAQQLRLAQTQVLAPDDGVISARSATVGAVLPAGTELFRMIRQNRLEWRAEVAASELGQLRPGQPVRVQVPGVAPLEGRVRMVAPTVDAATRNGLVYVDLPPTDPAAAAAPRAGMFARGEFAVGSSAALTLPQTAVLLRDGFSWVFRLGADNRVQQLKVEVGRRVGDRVEIRSGLDPAARLVASGVGFLADGDTVRLVAAPPVISPPGTSPVKPPAAPAAAGQ